MTTVVNLRTESFDVYIGRPGKGQSSKWGNPFKVGVHGQHGECIELYKSWLARRGQLLHQRRELKGKRLGCFCKPNSCHGDTLAMLAEMDDDQVRMWIDAVLATEEG